MQYGTHTIEEQYANGKVIATRETWTERIRVKDQKQELVQFMHFRGEHNEDEVSFAVEHTPNGDSNGFYYLLMSHTTKVL